MFPGKEGEGNTDSRDAQSTALGSKEARSKVLLGEPYVKVLMAC